MQNGTFSFQAGEVFRVIIKRSTAARVTLSLCGDGKKNVVEKTQIFCSKTLRRMRKYFSELRAGAAI